MAPLPSVEEDDRMALMILHNASNGRAWFRGDGQRWVGWHPQVPLGEWSGVAEKDGRAIVLTLYLCNLMGYIPAEIGSLSFLVKLDLGHNKLFGPIPPELGRLRALKTLDLYHNQLSGPIPQELCELSELVELNLGTNHLVGHIPAALGRLRSLELLRLTDNLLSGPIPVELSQLKALKILKLNGNLLEGGIPAELGNLPSLVSLWLNKNRLEGYIPQHLGALTSLESLWLKHNKGLKLQFAAGFYRTLCLTGPALAQEDGRGYGAGGRGPVGREPRSLGSDLYRLLNNPSRSDVTFSVEGKAVYGHRIGARCEPLERMLDGPMREACSGVESISLPNHRHAVFLGFLDFLYTNKVIALRANALDLEFCLDLMDVSDQFLVGPLKRLHEEAALRNIAVENACKLLVAADARLASSLRERCVGFITRHSGLVSATPGYSSLPPALKIELAAAAVAAETAPSPTSLGRDGGMTTQQGAG